MTRADSEVRLDGSEPPDQWENLLARKTKILWACPDNVWFKGAPLKVKQKERNIMICNEMMLFV
jgi:hypothetical protein